MTIEARDPEEGFRFTCPFCGELVVVFQDPLSVGHTLPACTVFLALNGEDFITAVNKLKARLN